MNAFNASGFRGGRPFRRNETPDAHRINHRITAREVRVISDTGEQLGVIALRDALLAAEKAGLDLVEVSGASNPPVCRIMDYGKFKYREQKKEAESRKKRTETELKELRIRYRTDVGDLDTKLRQAREFIEEGDKVKFSMRFKGREIMYVDLGQAKFKEIIERLADVATVDERSAPYGRMIYIVLAPLKGAAVTPKAGEKKRPEPAANNQLSAQAQKPAATMAESKPAPVAAPSK